jgi:two-component system, OmpR family, sensor histidine kinase KdpD
MNTHGKAEPGDLEGKDARSGSMGREVSIRSRPEAFLDLIRQEGRGNLKIYLGFAPGVGKTYRMLQEAHALKTKGVDVVIGVIDTHGREDTARLMIGLEQIPLRKVDYKGLPLLDLDMDAVLHRQPELVLVDELAHENAPGGHHERRWQDVEELLDKGINVLTTLNVQHVEGLNDSIWRITGVRVRETVPDRILTLADEIVDVDLPVDDLLIRLNEGKIYPLERLAAALQNFFQNHTLTALREFSLREVAKSVWSKSARQAATRSVDSQIETPKERVLVALSPTSPNSRSVLRKGARLAGELNTDWVVVFVDSPEDNEESRTVGETQILNDNLDMARKLGAEVVRLEGKTVAETILEYARRNRIGRIVVGRTPHTWLEHFLHVDVAENILRNAGPIDVYVVNFERPTRLFKV